MASFFVNSSVIGVDLNNVSTTSLFTPGSQVEGSASSEWVYVELGTPIGPGTMVSINATNTATLATATTTGSKIAFAQVSGASGSFAWVACRGNPLTVLVSATSTQLAVLYATAASGALTTTAGSGTMGGIDLLTASTTAVLTAYQAVVTWPRARLSGAD